MKMYSYSSNYPAFAQLRKYKKNFNSESIFWFLEE